jgi:fructoselysine 6-kinase
MKLAGVGDNVVDSYRDLGVMYPGGQALNVAVYAQRLGVEAAYLGIVGDDRAGRHVLSALRAEGVDVSRVRVEQGPNAVATVALVDGDRRFMGSEPGVSRFRVSDDDLVWLSGFDLIHSSESSFLEDQLGLLAAAAPVSFDFSERRDPDYIHPLLPHVQVAEFSLSDLDDAAATAWLERIHDQGPRLVLATRGTADALLYDGDRLWHQPTTPTEPVDTLGAGDAYIARFLVGLLRREPHETSLADAAVVAAATCGIYGAFGHGTAAVPPGTPVEGTQVVPAS